MSKIVASQSDLRSLLSDDPIPLGNAIRVLHAQANTLSEEIEYANTLLPEAGTYLSGEWPIRQLIRAEIGVDEVQKILDEKKLFIDRLRKLYPEIVRLFGISDPHRAAVDFQNFSEICFEYKGILANCRKEANYKKTILKIRRFRDRLKEVSLELADLQHELFEFDEIYKNHLKHKKNDTRSPRSLDEFKGDADFLIQFIDLQLHRVDKNPDLLVVADNQAKTHLVDHAYRFETMHGQPKFVTTPNSDFAYLCSILFEISTGIRDESLLGCISRYARSDLKAEEAHRFCYNPSSVRPGWSSGLLPIGQ